MEGRLRIIYGLTLASGLVVGLQLGLVKMDATGPCTIQFLLTHLNLLLLFIFLIEQVLIRVEKGRNIHVATIVGLDRVEGVCTRLQLTLTTTTVIALHHF